MEYTPRQPRSTDQACRGEFFQIIVKFDRETPQVHRLFWPRRTSMNGRFDPLVKMPSEPAFPNKCIFINGPLTGSRANESMAASLRILPTVYDLATGVI